MGICWFKININSRHLNKYSKLLKIILNIGCGMGLEVLKYKNIIKDIIKSKLIKELNIRTETIKLLELNCWWWLFWIWHQKQKQQKEK